MTLSLLRPFLVLDLGATIADDAEETDENGNIYSTCNTDGHWDWYEIGGRWSGLLKVGNEYVNSARVKDIDFGSEPFSTFAVLFPDGEWYEHEPVLVSECDWAAHYREQFIDMADPNMILTIVDCHI